MGKIHGIVGLGAIIMCLYFAYQGGNKHRKANFDKIPIITGIAIALVLGIGLIIGSFFL